MPEIEVSPTRRRVYRLAVDGKGKDSGLTVASIVKQMNLEGTEISRPAVEKHIKGLLAGGYIRKMPGITRPALYIRGERAAILDALECNPQCNPSHGGGGNVQNCRQPDNNTSTYIPSAETHIDGRYIFPVLKPGDLSPLKIDGEKVTIFKREPIEMNGVQRYSGVVPLDDVDIKVEYWDAPNKPALHVWPTPVELLPGRSKESEEELQEKAQRVANILSKYGGWRFGLPRFVGKYHYATNDPAIVGNFKEGTVLAKETHCWLDSTPPPRAFETDEPERMDAVINFDAITKNLKANMGAIMTEVDDLTAYYAKVGKRLDFAEYRGDRLDSIISKMQDNTERLAMIVQTILETEATKIVTKEGADPGVMYS